MKRRNEAPSALTECVVTRPSRRGIPRAASSFIIYMFLLSVFPTALSLNGETVEYPVKLAFLYNFAKYVEWPANSYSYPGAPLAICIVGLDPFDLDIEKGLQVRQAGGGTQSRF
jgi:hypothetical protein